MIRNNNGDTLTFELLENEDKAVLKATDSRTGKTIDILTITKNDIYAECWDVDTAGVDVNSEYGNKAETIINFDWSI